MAESSSEPLNCRMLNILHCSDIIPVFWFWKWRHWSPEMWSKLLPSTEGVAEPVSEAAFHFLPVPACPDVSFTLHPFSCVYLICSFWFFSFTMCEQWCLEDIYSISFKDIPDYRYEKKAFLNRTLLVQELRPPIDKWDLTKLKVFGTAEEMTNWGKRKPTEWERIFTSHVIGRGLISEYIKNCKKQMTHLGFGSDQRVLKRKKKE